MSHLAKVISFIEIDVPHCSLTYSVAPCQASLTGSPITGTIKCFNSLGTCQDIANFTDAPVTLRFGEDVRFEDSTLQYDALPLIKTIDLQPAIVSLAGSIGQRATLKVTFRDGPHSDAGPNWDKYPGDRNYTDPFSRGTFWGKFRARNPYLRGRPMRMIRGRVGQTLAEMQNHHYLIDSIDGPNAYGEFSIIAKDILKFADGDRSVVPVLSNGFLLSDVNIGATSATLSPSGIGDAEYPASGLAAIGGKEIVAYTRSSDALTITRAQLNTPETDLKAQDRVQVIYGDAGVDPADILTDLLQTYAGVDTVYINTSTDWQPETAAQLGVVYTFAICEPTPVAQLVSELLESMGAALWWDDDNQLIRLQVLRAIPTTAERWTEDNVLVDSLDVREQQEKRVSRVTVYFAQRNPLLKVDELSNYQSSASVQDDASEFFENSQAIKTITSRWIPQGGRAVAERIAEKHLSRYVKPPRRFNFDLMRFAGNTPVLGLGAQLGGPSPKVRSWPFQDETGEWVDIPIQITSINEKDDKFEIEAEEMLFTGFGADIDPDTQSIVFDSNQNNVNLRDVHDSLYGDPRDNITVNCYVYGGVTIGSNSTNDPAFDVGDWSGFTGITLNLTNGGRIQGCGGNGGNANVSGSSSATVGLAGGTAFFTTEAINLENNAEIWGGGGGGGATWVQATSVAIGGGGGSGTNSGDGGTATGGVPDKNNVPGQNGTTSAGGLGGNSTVATLHGGNGGGPGLAGASSANASFPGQVRAGGAAGVAIDGISNITLTGGGDIQGSQIN